LKHVGGKAVFISALIVQAYIILSFLWPWFTEQLPELTNLPGPVTYVMNSVSTIGFLWLNGVGAVGVVLLSIVFNLFLNQKSRKVLNQPGS
jgi:hypothetical protein